MAMSTTATVLHHADLARSPDFALELCERMVALSRANHDIGALHRWVRRYTYLRAAMTDDVLV